MLEQFAPFNAFHHYKHVLVRLKGIAHLHHIRMRDGLDDLNLIPEKLSLFPRQCFLVYKLHC